MVGQSSSPHGYPPSHMALVGRVQANLEDKLSLGNPVRCHVGGNVVDILHLLWWVSLI